jgi:Protein of unknown function (DUF1631)
MTKFAMPRLGLADDRTQAKPALRDCIEAVLLQSDALMSSVIDGLSTSHGHTKGRAALINLNPANKRAIEHLLMTAPAVKATFAEELRLALYNSGAHGAADQPMLRFDDFQFLEEKQIDANIEFAVTQQEVCQAVDDVLPPLNALMSNLLGLVTVQSQLNPLKPEAFVHAFRETLVRHIPDDAVRTVLITPAAGLLGISLRQLYKDASEWLRSLGVEPALPAGLYLVTNAAGGAKAPETAVSRSLLTLDKLRRLLSGDLDAGLGLASSGPKDFLHTVPASFVALEDLKLVEPMMQRLARRAESSEGMRARAAASAVTADGGSKNTQARQLGRQLGKEVVRLMLENLIRDNRLLPQVRLFLKELEPVLLQLSQTDPRFFSERQHPARQLLDRMTHRSLAFSSESDEGFGVFSKSISNAVRVLAGSSGDAATFTRVLRKLEQGWSRDEDVLRKQHEEGVRKLLHAEQRNLLAQRFAEEFVAQVKDKDVPELIVAFLRGPWSQVLAESQLRCTDGSSDPDGYQSFVDDLIWSVQLRLTRRNRPRLVQLVPNLLVKVRQGLQLISYPEERIPVFFDDLISLHEKAFEGPRATGESAEVPGAAAEGVAEEAAMPESGHEAVRVDSFEASESGFFTEDADLAADMPEDATVLADIAPGPWAPHELHTGAWVELMLQGNWVRAQLTWASPHRTLFMFVSGRGLAHSMSRRTMDRRRVQGMIRVVSDGNVVASALDAVAQTALRNNLGPVDA